MLAPGTCARSVIRQGAHMVAKKSSLVGLISLLKYKYGITALKKVKEQVSLVAMCYVPGMFIVQELSGISSGG